MRIFRHSRPPRLLRRAAALAISPPPVDRSVAQPGRAPRSGRGGRRFKSCHSDQNFPLYLKMLRIRPFGAFFVDRQKYRQLHAPRGLVAIVLCCIDSGGVKPMIEQYLRDAWVTLGDLKPGQAVMVTGFVGALTLVIGHVTNAWLTSRRDSRIDRTHRRRIEAALVAELEVVLFRLKIAIDRITTMKEEGVQQGRIFVPRCKSLMPLRDEIVKNMLHFNRRQINTAIHAYNNADGFDMWLQYHFSDQDILEEKGLMALIETDASRREVILSRLQSAYNALDRNKFQFEIDGHLHRDRWLRLPVMLVYFAPKRIRELLALRRRARAQSSSDSTDTKG